MSVTGQFRLGVQYLLEEVQEHIEKQPSVVPAPPFDAHLVAQARQWAADVYITLVHNLDTMGLLDKTPVSSPELQAIASEIRSLPIVKKSLQWGPLDPYECDRWLPVLESKLREMLEHLPPPTAVEGFARS